MGLGIGLRIKNRREELGLTQMELAQRMGYKSKAAVCKVERGDDNITTERVSKFAKALNCTESHLMGWEEESIEDFANTLSEEEIEIIKQFRSLDDDSKRKFVLMIAYWKENGLL